MTEKALVVCEKHGSVAVITLNRPEKRNAVNAAIAVGMRRLLQELAQDSETAVIILSGGKEFFCAGMDLQAFLQGQGKDIYGDDGHFAGFVSVTIPKPCIAAVEGFVLAGGFELALACDMVVAGESAVFGLPEVKVGLFAAAGGAFRLPLCIPPKKAVELLLTGERITAPKAAAYGLVNEVVPDGQALEAALKLAQKIAANAPLAVRASLEVARAAAAVQDEALWSLNDALWQQVERSRDAQEGPRAFLEKRPPNWRGE